MKCMFCHTDNHSIDECSKVDYCESGEHYVEIENIWDNFSECYNCTSTEEYAFFNNIPVEYAEKIKILLKILTDLRWIDFNINLV